MNFEVTEKGEVKIIMEHQGTRFVSIVSPEYGQAIVDTLQGAVDAAHSFNQTLKEDDS